MPANPQESSKDLSAFANLGLEGEVRLADDSLDEAEILRKRHS